MQIQFLRSTTYFSDLANGELFYMDGIAFVKVRAVYNKDGVILGNAVRIGTEKINDIHGIVDEIEIIEDDEEILPVEKITIHI